MPAILMSDEGVHEIQLNGKQLVFMFMAVTVVAVVIFLCGVMVGRGVRAPRATEQAEDRRLHRKRDGEVERTELLLDVNVDHRFALATSDG